ncbi:General transcription factor IIH subunit 1 [Wickerhamomyces ciferrii]|uniref:General transcription factor IIH subunit 1 n=1 Tax=Wickerhamomyces ciferrii (strain ATCC 14091 / BCRC 22168 / CBS 111 / JCM 3599 / NBRC 0793 / NRRL Y-1031 F-60-10) TaxID=1206466 RepID=K0KUM6_WICCF|nr:General transcription factor IIH subunit 1 [Wickerhamomyces ciferrii]CCH45134.1 General transcription factor IIH subunit 1 [Wickerhamomyces ciferrii]
MDLVYEQYAGSKSNNESQETLKATSDDRSNTINQKTEKSFEELEDGIANTYNVIESKASTWGASFGSLVSNLKINDYLNETKKHVENLHLNDKLNLTKSTVTKKFSEVQKRVVNEESFEKSQNMWSLLSTKTNTYLDELDKELEQVETFAGSYVNKFGQFIKDSIVVAPPEDRDELIDDDEGNLLFNVTGSGKSKPQKVTSTRTEAQLYALHTSPELFLTTANDQSFELFKKEFNLNSKTEDISKLLKQNNDLKKLSTTIVPEKSTYEEFWTRYYYLFDKILKDETNRKKLLNKEVQPNDSKTKNLQWSDDEDDEDNENNTASSSKNDKSTTSSEGTYELKSVNSSTLDVSKEHKVSSQKENEKESNSKINDDNIADEEEEDDDWE